MATDWFPKGYGYSTSYVEGSWLFPSAGVCKPVQYCRTLPPDGSKQFGLSGPVVPSIGDAFAILKLVTLPIATQTVSGTLQVCLPVGCLDKIDAGRRAYWAVHAYVSVGASEEPYTPDTVRGVLIDNYREGVGEGTGGVNAWPNTGAGEDMEYRSFSAPIAMSSVDAEDGDCIVIILGCVLQDDVPAWQVMAAMRTGLISEDAPLAVHGTAAAAAWEDDTDQGWVRFSVSVSPEVGNPADLCAVGGGGGGGGEGPGGYDEDCECCVATKLAVFNQALYKIGVSQSIVSLSEASREAYTCGQLWDACLRETLRQFPWAFATRYAKAADAGVGDAMELVDGTATEPAVEGEWQYMYRYPEDGVLARRIVNPLAGRAFEPTPIPFKVGRSWDSGEDTDFLVIYTNQEDAILEYTALVECAANFADALFEDALSWKLATKIAPSLSRLEDMAETAFKMYLITLDTAAAVSAREQQQGPNGEAEWIRGRA